MDYGRILTRAWEITWRWKILWILGLLASLANGFGGSNSSFRFNDGGGGAAPNFSLPPQLVGLLIALGCLAVIVGIVFWIVSTIARGGLIAGVTEVEDQGTTSFSSAWRVGVQRFGTLLVISIVTALPVIVLIIAGILGAILAFGGIAGLMGGGSNLAKVTVLIPLLACGIPYICGTIVFGLVLSQIRIYAERAAILEDYDWRAAIQRGWQVLRSNLGPTLVLWLIFLVLGLLFGAVVFGGVLALIAPFLAINALGSNPSWLLLPLCFGGLLGIAVAVVLSSIVETFTSATWTLAYRQLAGKPATGTAAMVTGQA